MKSEGAALQVCQPHASAVGTLKYKRCILLDTGSGVRNNTISGRDGGNPNINIVVWKI